MTIELPEGDCINQKVNYESQPLYCQDCLTLGHRTGGCKRENAPPRQNRNRRQRVQEWMENPSQGTEQLSTENHTEDVIAKGLKIEIVQQVNIMRDQSHVRTGGYEHVNPMKAKGKWKIIEVDKSKQKQALYADEELVERLLSQNQFSTLRIHPEAATQKVVKGSTPKENPT